VHACRYSHQNSKDTGTVLLHLCLWATMTFQLHQRRDSLAGADDARGSLVTPFHKKLFGKGIWEEGRCLLTPAVLQLFRLDVRKNFFSKRVVQWHSCAVGWGSHHPWRRSRTLEMWYIVALLGGRWTAGLDDLRGLFQP